MSRSIENIGFSDEYGSWKIGCTRWRNELSCLPLRLATSSPSKRMTPLVGSTTLSIMRAVVVLPEPDSPTIATVSPRGIANDTSLTAMKSSLLPRTVNAFVSVLDLDDVVGCGGRRRPRRRARRSWRGRRPVAGTDAAASVGSSVEVSLRNASGRSRTAATEGAARTRACVYGCCGSSRICARGALLDDAAAVHHDDARCALGGEAEVVRDEHAAPCRARRSCARADRGSCAAR